MSRRKQLNPKPFNKGDCSETTEEMTVDSRDSKELNSSDLLNEHHNAPADDSDSHSAIHNEDDVNMNDNHSNNSNSEEDMMSNNRNERESPCISPKLSSEMQGTPRQKLSKDRASNSPESIKQEPNEFLTTDAEEDTAEVLPSNRSPSISEAASISPPCVIPKLRLNTLLASDPALKPDAKDLKAMHEESQTKKRQSSPLDQELEAAAVAVDLQPRIKVFMCLPCGIPFSSPSTLEAHQAYYCSHRNKEDDENTAAAAADKHPTASISPNANASTALNNNNGEPSPKVIKTGKQYACTQCSYSADKKVSLNRHMRMHQTSPSPSLGSANGAAAVLSGMAALEECSSQSIDRYCSDCDIKFNNVKTYRAHKQHYCSSRRSEGQLTPKLEISTNNSKTPSVAGCISPQTRTKTPTPALVAAAAAVAAASLQPPPQPFLALPTNPILIIPCSLVRAASLIPGPLTTATSGIMNPELTCFTLENGALKPLASALSLANVTGATNAGNQIPIVDSTRQNNADSSLLTENKAARNLENSAELVTPKRKEGTLRESAPLDLSLRRSPIAALLQRQRCFSAHQQRLDMETLLEASKENLSLDGSGSITPEQIVCAPSLPNSPSMSPSPKRRAISPRCSSAAGSSSSMSPPAANASFAAAAAASNMLDSLQLRNILPADIALKLSESNMINPLLAKQNLELALKFSAAAAAAVSSSTAAAVAASNITSSSNSPAELSASKQALLNLQGMSGSNASTPTPGTPGAQPPQIYVKQGVSKCKECNIVFCKYENYLAHKQHYCSARNQDPNEGDTAKISSTPPVATNANTSETTPMAYQQLICAACGIKYTSLDNLRAHQNYYCPKRLSVGAVNATADNTLSGSEAAMLTVPKKEKCPKCKTAHELGQPCASSTNSQTVSIVPQAMLSSVPVSTSSNNSNVYKCPICDAVSLTASESRKHMETHGSVKAFRCSICRYKGNTLRGMRTHIRMHFDKKASDFNEEHYVSCILDDEGIEIPSAASLNQEHLAQQIAAAQQQQQQQAAQLQQQQQQQQLQQIFNCDLCSYSSTYKGNVIRHMKLVHPQAVSESPSMSPELSAEAQEATESISINGVEQSFTIKSEPMDHSSSVLSMSHLHDNNNSPPAAQSTISTSTQNELLSHIKPEPMEISIDPSSLPPLSSSPALMHSSPLINVSGEENAASPGAMAAAALNQKYCHVCDIPFNYMKTYLAHKQFYCKNKIRRPEESPSPVSAVQSPLLQKNKENLQQEAAI